LQSQKQGGPCGHSECRCDHFVSWLFGKSFQAIPRGFSFLARTTGAGVGFGVVVGTLASGGFVAASFCTNGMNSSTVSFSSKYQAFASISLSS